jgi:hypothetical protein
MPFVECALFLKLKGKRRCTHGLFSMCSSAVRGRGWGKSGYLYFYFRKINDFKNRWWWV